MLEGSRACKDCLKGFDLCRRRATNFLVKSTTSSKIRNFAHDSIAFENSHDSHDVCRAYHPSVALLKNGGISENFWHVQRTYRLSIASYRIEAVRINFQPDGGAFPSAASRAFHV